MAYTLKATGIATNLIFCVAVDSDGTTIKEFVSSDVDANKSLGTGVSAGVGASTWKGSSRGYFPTLTNGSTNYFGVTFASGHRPAVSTSGPGTAHSFWGAFAGMSPANGSSFSIIEYSSGAGNLASRAASSTGPLRDSRGFQDGSTSMPSDNSTKFSAGFTHAYGTTCDHYYGLESGSLAADGSGSDPGFGAVGDIIGIGGQAADSNQPAKWHIATLFNRVLTLTEFQSLHDDWFNTLFDSGGGGSGFFARRYYDRLIGNGHV